MLVLIFSPSLDMMAVLCVVVVVVVAVGYVDEGGRETERYERGGIW